MGREIVVVEYAGGWFDIPGNALDEYEAQAMVENQGFRVLDVQLTSEDVWEVLVD